MHPSTFAGAWLAAVGLWVVCGAAMPAAEPAAPAEPSESPIRVTHDPERFQTRISISAPANRVAWADVLRALARARGHDDAALEGILPEGEIDLTSLGWRVTRLGLNLALKPHIRFEVEPAAADGEPHLVVTLDRAALLASERRFKARLRQALTRRRPSQRHYGLELEPGWEKAAAEQNLVVVVHGLDSSPERCDALLATIRKAGLPAGAFRYPNDQPIADSARLLSSELKRLGRQFPARGVALVTHSMGGLVARAAVEDPQLDPGNVRQLILIAPPNHGSALARFEFALDLGEHLKDQRRKRQAGLFYAVIEDGMSEAAGDLMPGSPFLKNLNGRPRNPKIRYTIFLGTAGPLSEDDLALLRQRISAAGQENRWVRFFGARVQTWLEDLDEVVEGKGDGAVSLARGRLEGVDDTAVLKFSHLGGGNDAERLDREVLARLAAPRR